MPPWALADNFLRKRLSKRLAPSVRAETRRAEPSRRSATIRWPSLEAHPCSLPDIFDQRFEAARSRSAFGSGRTRASRSEDAIGWGLLHRHRRPARNFPRGRHATNRSRVWLQQRPGPAAYRPTWSRRTRLSGAFPLRARLRGSMSSGALPR